MNVPGELWYSSDHEWVRIEDDRIVLGITDYAQDALGDVVYVDMPNVGDTITAGETFGEVESTKSVSDLFSPLTGVISEVNDALNNNPELINEDPYGDGWICAIEKPDELSTDGLLDAAAYVALTEG